MEGDRNYEEGGNRVSTKPQIGASSVGSGRCVKSKMLHFLRKNAWFGKDSVKPSKNRAKKIGIRVTPSAPYYFPAH
jgi:hypothetical protein